jgi:predicted DNA-binding protein (MmcQ/YjbR family)
MDLGGFLDYCLNKKGVEETFPFGETTLVLKVMGKMFAAYGIDESPLTVNLKCDPDRSLELREQYEDIQPGYHMNKKHWNTVNFEGNIEDKIVHELIDHSYELVVKSLTREKKALLDSL